jgi:hypothetical protein
MEGKQIDAAFWSEEENTLFRLIFPLLQSIALVGGTVALADLNAVVSIGVDWGLVNANAVSWARAYGYELVKGITDTTAKFLQTEIADWMQSGQPLDELISRIAPMYGPVRAGMIASTEVTRAFDEGNDLVWKESQVVEASTWRTAEDELVCAICGPLSRLEPVPLGEPFIHPETGDEYMSPPAHVNCRCGRYPVVKMSKAIEGANGIWRAI